LDLLHELAEATQAGLGGQDGLLVELAQHPQQTPQLGERLTAGRLDRVEGLAGLVGVQGQHPPAAPRLDHHHADPVRDDVVQLTRDPRAFLGDRGAGPFLPVKLELVGSRLLPSGPALSRQLCR